MKEGIRLLKLARVLRKGFSCREDWAGDGLEQASRIWNAFILRNLSYILTFINLMLI